MAGGRLAKPRVVVVVGYFVGERGGDWVFEVWENSEYVVEAG